MKKSIIILGLIFTITSCTKENFQIDKDNVENITTFEDYLKLIKSDADALIAISNVSSLETTDTKTELTSIKKGNTNPFDFTLNNQSLNSNNYSNRSKNVSNWNIESKTLNSFYGSNLKLNLKDNKINANFVSDKNAITNSSLSKGSDLNTDLYIPELLKVNVTGLKNGKVVAGTTFTWNADPNNKKGIVIGVEYKKQIQTNQSIAENNTKNIARGSTISDSGSYTVSSLDLSHFANDAVLTFSIGRAGYTILNNANTNMDVIVGAYTIVRTDFNISN